MLLSLKRFKQEPGMHNLAGTSNFQYQIRHGSIHPEKPDYCPDTQPGHGKF
jgi:hypothetical protein